MAVRDAGGALTRPWSAAFAELERTTAGALAETDRPLGALGHLGVWAMLGSGLYLLVVGAWLVPALSIPQAVAATLIGAGLGAALVAVAVRLGAGENRPAVVLHRGALGDAGASVYGALAVFRHLAWGVIQLAIAAELLAAVTARNGVDIGRGPWAGALGAIVLLMLLAGPATVLKRLLVPSALLALLIGVAFTYSAWSDFGVPSIITREPSGGWPGMAGAVDLVAALAVLWLPVATDLGRFGAPRHAGLASFAGLGVMTTWFVLIGVLFVPAVDGADLAGFLLATPLGLLAVLLVIVLELDGAFVSLYALGSTVRGWLPKTAPVVPTVIAGAAVFATGGALLRPFERGDALLLLGAAFVPLLGVLLGARTARRFAGHAPPLATGDMVAWGLGFLLYNWASPLQIPGWTDAMSGLFGGVLRMPFPADAPGLSATALSFLAAFVVATVAASLQAWFRATPKVRA